MIIFIKVLNFSRLGNSYIQCGIYCIFEFYLFNISNIP